MPDFAAFARFAPNLTRPLVLAGFGRRIGAGSGNAFLCAPTRPRGARSTGRRLGAGSSSGQAFLGLPTLPRGVPSNRRRGRLRVSA